jgi:glutamine amidotransferase
MITIIDYGLGNVLAFVNVYKRENIPVKVARTAADLVGATRLILPGVGSFDHAMVQLTQSGMRAPLEAMVVQDKVPVMGICVGMQMLADGSDEGTEPGLGWVPGRVRKFDPSHLPAGTLLPHMGWNDVHPTSPDGLFRELEQNARFYFLHSYYFECADGADALARTDYGPEFSCAVRRDNVYGVQFHPEKSHHFGARLLSNFASI